MTVPVRTVRAAWDPEAGIYFVAACDIPGLACEAVTVEDMMARIRERAGELLALNPAPDAPASAQLLLRMFFERRERARTGA